VTCSAYLNHLKLGASATALQRQVFSQHFATYSDCIWLGYAQQRHSNPDGVDSAVPNELYHSRKPETAHSILLIFYVLDSTPHCDFPSHFFLYYPAIRSNCCTCNSMADRRAMITPRGLSSRVGFRRTSMIPPKQSIIDRYLSSHCIKACQFLRKYS
jgi:hypothetical protein